MRPGAVVAAAALVALSSATGARASFPGENGRIVYMRLSDGDFDLFTIRRDGSDRRRLTRTARFELDPAVSPNGRWVAFTRTDGEDAEIFKIHADGSGEAIQLTNNRPNDYDPAWSPSGRRLVFVRQPRSDTLAPPANLFTIASDGTDVERVTDTPETEQAPAWSPDGERIAYCRGPSLGDLSIYTIKPQGGRRRRLTGAGSYNCSPTWSPGGGRIAFYSDRDGDGDIFKMLRTGRRQRHVTRNAVEDGAPAWSPRGDWIAYTRFERGYGIRRIRPDGSGDRGVIDGPNDEQSPDWGPRI